MKNLTVRIGRIALNNRLRTTQTLLLVLFFGLLFNAANTQAVVAEVENGGGGGWGYDNDVLNPGFESGTTSWSVVPGSAGSSTTVSSPVYLGTAALRIYDVRPAVWGTTMYSITQATSESITSETKLGAAVYLDANIDGRGAMVILHISPANYDLWYYVSDTTDFPDVNLLGEKHYTFDMGSTQYTWHHFYRNVYEDIQSKGENPVGQTVSSVTCHVRTIGWFNQYCNGYFDHIYLGSTPPSASISAPSDGIWISGTYTFSGTATDNRGQGLGSVYYIIDPFETEMIMGIATGNSAWTANIDTTQLSDGHHEFYALAFDATGSVAIAEIDFNVDNVDPSLTVSMPTEDQWLAGTVTISGTASDGLSGLSVIKVRIDDGTPQSALGTTSWSYSLDTTAVSDGAHEISVTAYDVAGNSMSSTVSVNVDNTAPVMSSASVSPSYGTAGTQFTVSINAADAGIGIDTVVATIQKPDGTEFTLSLSGDANSESCSFTLTASDLQGTYSVKSIVARDKLGNTATLTPTDVRAVFDYTLPVVSIISPESNSVVSGSTVTWSGTASDSPAGIQSFTLSIDGASPISLSVSSGTWSYSWSTGEYADGFHVFKFVCVDNAGNTRIDRRNVILRNSLELVAPYIPAVDQNGDYIGSARVTIGNAQLIILMNVPPIADSTRIILLIAPPFSQEWSLLDISYVDGENTVSFADWPGVVWNSSANSLSFPASHDITPSTRVSLAGRSVIVSVQKLQLSWTLDAATQYDVLQGVNHSITITLSDAAGGLPYGTPADARLEAIQDNRVICLVSSVIDSNGVVLFTFSLDSHAELTGGPFSVRVVLSSPVYAVHDIASTVSPQFEGFVFLKQPSWTFDPADSVLVHYSPTYYDQREFEVRVVLSEMSDWAEPLIGHAIQVTIIGPGTSETVTIYQTRHADGIYAQLTYALTTTGEYQFEFDYIPSGFYLELANHNIIVMLEGQRPVSLVLQAPDDLSVGVSAVLMANLTDTWAGEYPVDGVLVVFGYELDGGVFTQIGTSYSDGFGIARVVWSPSDAEWLATAGREIGLVAASSETPSHQSAAAIHVSAVGRITTSFLEPLAVPTEINAGGSVAVTAGVQTQLGAGLEVPVTITVTGPSGYSATYALLTNGTALVMSFDAWGRYTIVASFAGSAIYAESSTTTDVTVDGLRTICSVTRTGGDDANYIGEPLDFSFFLTDLLGTSVEGALLSISIQSGDDLTTHTIVIGENDTVVITPTIAGAVIVEAAFLGDGTYEPSSTTVSFAIQKRPTDVYVEDTLTSVHPFVGPSFLTYPLSATIYDGLNGLPLEGVSVLFCYITLNDTVYLPFMNETGHVNLTLANDYLAWGFFHEIGTAQTGAGGRAEVEWSVDLTEEQVLKVFALTLQDDLHMTGVSEVLNIEYSRIETAVQVESKWLGEDKMVTIQAILFDEYGYLLFDESLEVVLTSFSGTYNTSLTLVTGFNNSVDLELPEYGTYHLAVSYAGSEWYLPVPLVEDIFSVSFRQLEITLEIPDAVRAGEPVELIAHVVDLNATSGEPLYDVITVHFAYFADGARVLVGSGVVDGDLKVSCIWTPEPSCFAYEVFAYSARTLIYDAAMSDFHLLSVVPIGTSLTIAVDSEFTCSCNLVYTFSVTLQDEWGESLDGALVDISVTDNYTEFWRGIHARQDCDLYCQEFCDCYPLYHVFHFTVIIGENSTFSWQVPRECNHISPKGISYIAIAEYSGSGIYLPSIATQKLSRFLNLTETDLWFDTDPFEMCVGMPQLIRVSVTDERGEPICRGLVNITIVGPDGQVQHLQLDLAVTSSVLWTPTSSGRYTIKAEFLGGPRATPGGCHGGRCPSGSPMHWRLAFLHSMRLTRSYDVATAIVSRTRAILAYDALPSDIHGESIVFLRAYAYDSLTQVPLSHFLVRFYYLDENGQIVLIGSNYTTADGVATLLWTVSPEPSLAGYETLYLFASVDGVTHYATQRMGTGPLRVWPEPPVVTAIGVSTDSSHEPAGERRSEVDSAFGLGLVTFLVFVSITSIYRVRPDLIRHLALMLVILSMLGGLYFTLGIESFYNPYKMSLIADLQTSPCGASTADAAYASSGTLSAESSLAIRDMLMRSHRFFGQGTSTVLTSLVNTEAPTGSSSFSTTAPNATYVIVPLGKTLTVNFTAVGRYVVSVLDASRIPVDTVAGMASGAMNTSFFISPEKYQTGHRYSLNIFVTTERFGITYGDTMWVVMLVSPVATYTELLLEDDSIQYTGSSVDLPLVARVTKVQENATVPGGEVQFYYRTAQNLTWHYIDSAETDGLGVARVSWSVAFQKGDFIVNATYTGDDSHDKSVSAKLLTVEGGKTLLNYAPGYPTTYSVQYGHPFSAHVQLKSYNNQGLFNTSIQFYLVDEDIAYWIGASRTDSSGIAAFQYTPYLRSGVYGLEAQFEGDENYAPSNMTLPGSLIVLKQLSHFGGPIQLTASAGRRILISVPLANDLDRPLSDKYADFEVHCADLGSWLTIGTAVTDLSGQASLDYLVTLEPGLYPFRVSIRADYTTEATALQGTLRVVRDTTSLYCIPVEADFGRAVSITANLEDERGRPLVGETILFYARELGVWRLLGHAETNELGWAEITWTADLPAGSYDLCVVYPGSGYHESAEYVFSGLVVTQLPSVLLISSASEAHVTQPTSFNATLLDADGAPLVAREVSFVITHESGAVWDYVVQTDSSGEASLVFVPPYLGDFGLVATFSGDDFYSGSTVERTFVSTKIGAIINLVVSQVSAHRGDTIRFSGYGSYYSDAEERNVPLEEGVVFDLQLVTAASASIGSEFQIVTVKDGVIEGYWTIPSTIGGSVSALFLAQEYEFRVAISSGSIYYAKSEFDLDIVLRTTLAIAPVFPIINGTPADAVYVDMPMSHIFELLDEDGLPLDGLVTRTDINGDGWNYYETDSYGQWSILDYVQDRAGFLRIAARYGGSRFLDPAEDIVYHQVVRRPAGVSFELDSYFVHRGDAIAIEITTTDLLYDGPVVDDEIPARVLFDGFEIASFKVTSSAFTTTFVLPVRLDAGAHTIRVAIGESRVYDGCAEQTSLEAYEYVQLSVSSKTSVTTDSDVETRVTLFDEDATPLANRFISLDIEYPDGSLQTKMLRTDSIGRTATMWAPTSTGSYTVSSSFAGEHLYCPQSSESLLVEAVQGGAQSEAAVSPLWILPLILAVAVDVVLEVLTFGLISYIDVTTKMGDGYIHISKYSYPWIEVIYVDIPLPWGGSVRIPIPMVVVRSGYSFEVTQGDNEIAYSMTDYESETSSFNGVSMFQYVLDGFSEILDGGSTKPAPTLDASCSVPSASAVPSELPPADRPQAASGELEVQIVSPTHGGTVTGTHQVAARVLGVAPENVTRVTLTVGSTEVGEMVHQGEGLYTYDWDTTVLDPIFPKYGNGYKWLTVKAEARDGSSDINEIAVDVFNWGSLGIGLVVMLIIGTLTFFLNKAIIHLFDVALAPAKANKPLEIFLQLLKNLFLMLFTFGIYVLAFQLLESVLGYTWMFIGILVGMLAIIVGIILVNAIGSEYKTPKWKLIERLAIAITAGVVKVVNGIVNEMYGSTASGFTGPVVSIISGLITALVTAAVMQSAFKASVTQKFQGSIRNHSIGIGFLCAGILIIFRTLKNMILLYRPRE